jgi:alpha-tubulin suppressor-like RCC1 family protein
MRRIVIALALVAAMLAGASPPAAAEPASSPAGEGREAASRIALGHDTMCVVLDNGSLRCWGNNIHYTAGLATNRSPLGVDETPDRLPTVDVGSGRAVEQVDGGIRHTCALLDDGDVRCWGRNSAGAVGVPGSGSVGDNETPAAIPPVQLGGAAEMIASGYVASCAILTGGSVRCWGSGDRGQLGTGNEDIIGDDEHPASIPPVDLGGTATAISVGGGSLGGSACAILTSGAVRCWGSGASLPIQGPATPPDVGDDEAPSSVPAFELGGRSAVAISAGNGSTCGLNDLGEVYCWGRGRASRLSTGTGALPPSPTKVDLGGKKVVSVDLGDSHACVVFEDGGLTCWGEANDGRLGYGNENDIGDDEPPTAGGLVDLGEGRTAVAVTAGSDATCALLDNDTVRCWGAATSIGSGQPLDIGDDELPTAIGPVNYIGTAAFRPLTPARILDTRPGFTAPAGSPKGFVAVDSSIDVQVSGLGGVPDDDVYAVALNVTVTATGGRNFVTVYPTGEPRPTASNLNVTRAGFTAPNLVIVPVGEEGKVSMYIGDSGGGHLVADVLGYYEQTGSSADGRLIGVTPKRVFDTRPEETAPGPKGLVPAGETITVKMTDANGVPASGVSAVVFNLTATRAVGAGFVTAYPGDETLPLASNLNVIGPGATRANSAIVPVAPDGTVKLYTSVATHLLADITGYFTDATAEDTDDGLFVPLVPSRLLDTRSSSPNPLPAGGTTDFAVTGQLGIPSTANAIVLNVTATRTGGRGYVTGWPSDLPQPFTSNVNYVDAGDTVPNAAILPLSRPSGRISLFTFDSAHLIADTAGYHL